MRCKGQKGRDWSSWGKRLRRHVRCSGN